MKCEEVQQLLIGLAGDGPEIRLEDALSHVRECRECAEVISFDSQLKVALDSQQSPPQYLLGSIRQSIAESQTPQPWIHTIRRSKLMKKLVFSAVSMAVATSVVIGVLTRSAYAADAKGKFATMKKAVFASSAANSQEGGGGQVHSVHVNVGQSAGGAIHPWFLVDGKLVELSPDVPFEFRPDNGAAQVSREMTDPTPEQKALLDEALQKASASGLIVTAAYLNGNKVELSTDVRMQLDLDEKHYQSIAFGKTKNTLLLTPKGKEDRRYVVMLDPKSSLPKNISLQLSKGGQWTQVKQSVVKLDKAH